MTDIREFRLLVKYLGKMYRLCKFAFSKSDASIYLFPYAPNGKYFFGKRSMPEKEFVDEFDYSLGGYTEDVPKLSIHESGKVYISVKDYRSKYLQIPPLIELSGEHIATVSVDEFRILSEYHKKPKFDGSEVDAIIDAGNLLSAKILIFINGGENKFKEPGIECVIELKRMTISKPIYVGIKPVRQEPIGEPEGAGIVVLAGFDPTEKYQEGLDYYYIRGQ